MRQLNERFKSLLEPGSIAFIGATNSHVKWGGIVLKNLIKGGFQGNIYPINPKEKEVLGIKAYSSVMDLPESPDMAVIIIPPAAVLPAIEDCVKKGIRAGLIITAGFAEVGKDGGKLQSEIVEAAGKGGMVLVGPNCNGLVRPSKKFYPLMPSVFPESGAIALISQSGNVAQSIARRGIKKGFGFSSISSTGNEADLHCEDFFEYLGNDPETKVIISYIEGIKNGKRFFDIAGQVTRKKPLIMVKIGATEAGAKAAMSHTAALAGTDQAFEGLCKQLGIIRTDKIEDLFSIGTGFLNQPLPKGNRVGIVTMGGGWGVLAAEASAKSGLDVVALSPETLAKLDKILPPWWNPGNPVDMVAGNSEGTLFNSVRILMEAPETDCVLMLDIMSLLKAGPIPSSAEPDEIEKYIQVALAQLSKEFDRLKELSFRHQKPLIAATELSFPLGDLENRMIQMLGKKEIACYDSPNMAAITMSCIVDYGRYRNRYTGKDVQ